MVDVWDLPLRLFHWALAASVLIAWFSANVLDTVHEIAGYTVLVLIAFRIVWGFAGTRYSRFRQFRAAVAASCCAISGRSRAGRPGAISASIRRARAMSVALLVLLAVSTISGWMQITERFFGVDWVERLHTCSSNLVLILAVVHVLGVLLMCALQKENLVRAMITGKKRARDE